MKKTRIIKMLTVIILSCSLLVSTKSYAAEPNDSFTIIYNDIGNHLDCYADDLISPQYNTVCGNLPYHRMTASGLGTVYLADGSRYILLGACWQCPTCKLVMVTEGDLVYDVALGTRVMGTIGRYAFYPEIEDINRNGAIIYTPTSYGYCSQNSMDGYRFYAAG